MRKQKSMLLGDILSEYFLHDTVLRKGLYAVKVKEAYKQAVGPIVAESTLKLRFKDGVLTCKMSSSVMRMSLMGSQFEVMESMNRILRNNDIKKVIFA